MSEDIQKDELDDSPDIVINGSEGIWQINSQGTINGTYIGSFKFKCALTPTQRIAADREYRQLLGPYATMAPQRESFLAYALTQLKYRIVSAPPFWNSTVEQNGLSGDLTDENVIEQVLDAAIRTEMKYRNQFKKRIDNALKDSKAKAEKIKADQEQESKAGDKEDES